MSRKKDRKKNRKTFNARNKMVDSDTNVKERLAEITKNRDKELADIKADFNKSQETVPIDQGTQPESSTLDIENDETGTIEPENVMQEVEISDDINSALISVFKEVVRSPHAVPGKVIPFAQVLLKKRILDLKSIDPKIVASTMSRFENIWNAFELSETDEMLFLNDAINGEIGVLNDIQREIDINEKALYVLSDKNATVSVNRKKFGGGIL